MKNFPKKAAAVSEVLIVLSAAIIFFSDVYKKSVAESFNFSSKLLLDSAEFIYAACLIVTAANLLIFKRKTKLAPIIMSAAAVVSAYIFNADVRHSKLCVMDNSYLQKYFDLQYGFDAETANTVFFLLCAAVVITVCGAVYALADGHKNVPNENMLNCVIEKGDDL